MSQDAETATASHGTHGSGSTPSQPQVGDISVHDRTSCAYEADFAPREEQRVLQRL